jgi:hypothetical protein
VSELLGGLPDVFGALIGPITARLGPEPLATCGDCALKPRPGSVERAPVFPAAARCCTYHPRLPAFLVGRALRRGGEGAAKIRARLAEPDGVSAEGIRAPASHRAAAAEGAGFGHEQRLTCPFWSAEAPQGRGCTVHLDREAVCRTWHCRRDQGIRSHAAWMALKELLMCVEATLVDACVAGGEPPGQGAPPEVWEAWFVACADRVDGLGPGEVDRLRGERLDTLRARVAARLDERDAPMPEVVIPTLRSWVVRGDGITLTTWSAYDPVEAPPWIFELLSRLDGQRTWRVAAALTEAAIGVPVGDALVARLYRRGALGPPEYVDVMPGLTVVPTRTG